MGRLDAQWHGSLLPRIRRFLPAGTILEIAPGYGRWTHFLRDHCDRLVVVDLAESCIDACKERFAGDERIEYHVNDGRSLDMIDDATIDFAFSFDSLVHVETDVIVDYFRGLAKKLTPGGAGFFHHANAGAYASLRLQKRLPRRVGDRLVATGVVEYDHMRALGVRAEDVRRGCEAAGLVCISQELVNWQTKRLIDCFTTFTTAASAWAGPTKVVRNTRFMEETEAIRRAAAQSA